jgi:hypothetical protein
MRENPVTLSRMIIPALLVAGIATPAVAGDRAERRTGIEMIRSETAKKPAAAVLTKLQTALRVAEREDREQEFGECLDAVKDARKALGR